MKYGIIVCMLTSVISHVSLASEELTSFYVPVLLMNGKGLTEIPKAVCNVGNLRELHLNSNSITEIPECIKNHATTLTILDMNSNKLTDIKSVAPLTSLLNLDLRQNKLEDISDKIGRLRNLEILYLGRNEIQILPSSMANLVYLKHLDLSYNKLTKIPEFLPYLVNLESVNLIGNTGLSTKIELIRKLLPGVNVQY